MRVKTDQLACMNSCINDSTIRNSIHKFMQNIQPQFNPTTTLASFLSCHNNPFFFSRSPPLPPRNDPKPRHLPLQHRQPAPQPPILESQILYLPLKFLLDPPLSIAGAGSGPVVFGTFGEDRFYAPVSLRGGKLRSGDFVETHGSCV